VVNEYESRLSPKEHASASVVVSGWAMDNMKPLNFILSHQPLMPIDPDSDAMTTLYAMIQSADSFASGVLRPALKAVVGAGQTCESLYESFYVRTQQSFEKLMRMLIHGSEPLSAIAQRWVRAMEIVALQIFDRAALQGLSTQSLLKIKAVAEARESLCENFAGRRKPGSERYAELDLIPRPKTKAA
jgi:CRISPR system Cascade subunit CasA